LFVVGLSSFMVLDVTYALIQDSSSAWVDIVSNLYPMVYALMIAALWHPSSPDLFGQAGEGSDRLTGGRLFLLGSALFIIPVLNLVDHANGKQQSIVSTVLSFIVTAFVLLRLARLVAEREQARIQLETVNDELKATHGAVKYQATHDPLSGLANRSALFEHFSLLADDRRIAVLFTDLDGFKAINDTHGHQAGDQLLIEVARRLESVVNPDELVCRVGGDEFVIVCPVDSTRLDRPLELAGAISEVLADPIDLSVGAHGVRVGVGISVGISRVSPSSSFERLLGEADEAMYAAKRSRCGHVVYGEDVDSMSGMTAVHGHHRTAKRNDDH
jgi:diguanylate cyclase (GGDEF)-like protein